MSSVATFASVHVVSDLHLGGTPADKQIFKQGDIFAETVEKLRRMPKNEPHALVLNGDLVDFLAEPKAVYFDTVTASDKLDRIIGDPAFAPAWKALREYVQTQNRSLILTLGNHDLELALPALRRRLLQELSGGDHAAMGRITLAFEHEGYRARVGNAEVLCVHGNEVDLWNVTDYEQLRRMCRDSDRGLRCEPWRPNAGTKLVIDVMNFIKKDYAFVDLLKPETQAVLPSLLVLDPTQAEKIEQAIPSVLRLGWDAMRRAFGFLGDAEGPAPLAGSVRHAATSRMLLGMLEDTFGGVSLAHADAPSGGELLRRAEDHFHAGRTPRELLQTLGEPQFLNVRRAIWNMIRGRGRSEVLREALERIWKDTSFDRSARDTTYKALAASVPKGIHFLAVGHTHLERALTMGNGRYYFNSGTWVRLIRLAPEVLASETRFKPVYEALADGKMATLDDQNLTKLRPTVVAFWADKSGTHGALRRLANGKLEDVQDTHFVRA